MHSMIHQMILSVYVAYVLPLSGNTWEIKGIDVSHHQDTIDWYQVKQEGVLFAFIKASEGAAWNDRLYKYNYTEAKKNNICVGAYHYFTFCKSGLRQAKNFISVVQLSTGDLPPVVDLEYKGNCSNRLSNKELIIQLRDFCFTIERAFGVKPILYTTPQIVKAYDLSDFRGYIFWMKFIDANEIMLSERYDVKFIQGRIDTISGIRKPVDRNYFCEDQRSFDRLLIK